MAAIAQLDLREETNLVNTDKLLDWSFQKKDLGSVKKVETGVFLVDTEVHLDKRFKLSTPIPLNTKNVKKGEKLLLVFTAKTEKASLETDEAKVLWQLGISESQKDRIRKVISISSDWKTYYIPIEMQKYTSKKHLELVMQFGFPPQKFLIKNIGLYHFGKDVAMADLPKTQIIYKGMEAEAPWRKEAFARIDSVRKGDFKIVITQGGEPLENVGLEINMIKHHFDWGVALQTKKTLGNDFLQNKVANGFNLVVLENDLKIKFYDRRVPKEDILATIDQLRHKGIKTKGHVLVWPGFRHLTPEFKAAKEDPEEVTRLLNEHLEKILAETNGSVDRWDVVNEAYTNNDLQKITGSEEILYKAFRKMKSEYPSIKRFVNEFGIINRGGLNSIKQEWYYDYIKRVDEHTDGAVDGIGIQSHIGTDLTPPTKVLQLLDYYAELGKDISISEFTMDIEDPIVRQLYTEDFLIAAYSHPAVSEFLFWGMKGGLNDKVDIYNEDWSLGTMGKAYFGLVHGLWKTRVSATTDSNGTLVARGIYGTYEYTYIINGELRKGKFKHTPGQDTVVRLEL